MTIRADAHCHAWERWPYDLAAPDAATRGSVDALLYEMDRNDIDVAAVVCARIGGGRGGAGHANDDNNDYVASAARRHPDRLVAWVDVDSTWSPDYHTTEASQRLKREVGRVGASGFAHYVGPENDGWLARDEGVEFLAAAAELGLIASISATPDWLRDVRSAALQVPTLPILLHHMGLPMESRADPGTLDEIMACAEVPNIGIKVSGFHYNAAQWWNFPHIDVDDLFRQLVVNFGVERLLWGSDFPAARDHVTYRQSMENVRRHENLVGPEGLGAIMGGNLLRLLGR